ncbi:hypothetical protein TK0057 [Thermococcus kodakarensis KOD1]|uniref:Transcription regulator, Lrp/AsnC family n=1 Tax=Thermococcus kodakarensis (strain ATCC BAA-918 / JCM 12380 / KOD1) TaxID=69014 RepID=Q5JEG8_THEKO|nr:hypothetical protein [Thermococcus kodakarensis]WCN28172.1 hypothetical protein POG15_00300 [Thermococcus kodakarensis]WCN30469.1 hypothetical protein POG21_00300 [Thermococcus kodakarensis]BAD84246.1 hypothetical protein TK0057 [Thermococcus kodakarensis KOD1]
MDIEAILLVWGVRDEILRELPVEGQWLYGEYDFIARVDFSSDSEMEDFERLLRKIINGNTFKLMPVKLSASKTDVNGEEKITILESVKVSAP